MNNKCIKCKNAGRKLFMPHGIYTEETGWGHFGPTEIGANHSSDSTIRNTMGHHSDHGILAIDVLSSMDALNTVSLIHHQWIYQ